MAARQFGAKREARKAVRRLVDLECAVYSELWGEAIAHRVTDVSEEGLWIQTDLLLEIGNEVTLTFYPPDWEEPLYVAGRVQRVELQRKPGDGRAVGMGIEFEKGTIYKSFIRPKLEYASILFDSCSKILSDKLESVQRQAALTCSGAYRRTKHVSLLDEMGWESLEVRRRVQKLILFYKCTRGLVPQYLCSLLTQRIGDTSHYNLRNQDDYRELPFRTVRFKKSFIPSSISLWNKLQLDVRNIQTLSGLKSKLREMHYKKINKLLLYGTSHGGHKSV